MTTSNDGTHLVQFVGLVLDAVHGKVRRTDLLGNAACLALLDVRPSNLIQQLRLTRVYVTQDTTNGRSQTTGVSRLLCSRFSRLQKQAGVRYHPHPTNCYSIDASSDARDANSNIN